MFDYIMAALFIFALLNLHFKWTVPKKEKIIPPAPDKLEPVKKLILTLTDEQYELLLRGGNFTATFDCRKRDIDWDQELKKL